jgi:hypothetical protein
MENKNRERRGPVEVGKKGWRGIQPKISSALYDGPIPR